MNRLGSRNRESGPEGPGFRIRGSGLGTFSVAAVYIRRARRGGSQTRPPAAGRGFLVVALIVMAIVIVSCSRHPILVESGSGQAKQQASTPFPASNEAPGWVRSGETRTFTPENLYEYIDGGADKFIQAGLKTTGTQDYRYQNKIEATADIYTMNASEGAKKMFASESSTEGQRVAVGDTAQLSKGSLIFVKGAHYVKLVAYQQPPDAGKALTELAQAIERKLAP